MFLPCDLDLHMRECRARRLNALAQQDIPDDKMRVRVRSVDKRGNDEYYDERITHTLLREGLHKVYHITIMKLDTEYPDSDTQLLDGDVGGYLHSR